MSDSKTPEPIYSAAVEEAWIDHNGHMNVTYYTHVFDQAEDVFLANLGVDQAYRKRKNKTMMAVESHIVYEREAHLGDHLDVTVRLVGYDQKRFHLFSEMFHREEGARAATCEWMLLHVDFAKRGVTDFDAEELGWLETTMDNEKSYGPVVGAGRALGLKNPIKSALA